MAKMFSMNSLILNVFLLAIALGCATSARILDEVEAPKTLPLSGPTTTTPPSGQTPATLAPADAPISEEDVPAPVADVAPESEVPPVTDVAPVTSPAVGVPSGPITTATATATSTTVAQPDAEHPSLSFFMHDILGGTSPSGRIVTGVIANSEVSNLPFSKPNDQVFPVQGGVPLINGNTVNSNGVINNNNIPSFTGLNNNQPTTVIQNNGNNNQISGNNNQPFVTAGQLPAGATLQQLLFGSITVIDDELTETHDLGSAVLGKAQGFYLASSIDGSSHTMALTTLFHSGDHEEDTLSFFGVHRTASPESQIAIVGGTGKYENAKGYATIQTLHQGDQHTTDGVDTIIQFDVYLTH
ncbi:Dirigent protein [Dillenia turbinata]|uniref:Dirigent protein n=1 Tax=Dillenia turbinata TaxID=194707 RepID=A0AAN8VSN6_9MAGN